MQRAPQYILEHKDRVICHVASHATAPSYSLGEPNNGKLWTTLDNCKSK